MRAIETTGVVAADHTLTVTVPADIPPGAVRVVVVIENGVPVRPPVDWVSWPAHNVALADPTYTFRREDMYDDVP